ncbi:MAG: cupredoxin domain-containing protein [Gemmatimonadaceae bacterium]
MTLTGDGYGGAEAGRFAPASVSVVPNGTVTWSNASGALHNVTFTTAGAPANVPDIATGSAQRVFPNAGTFNFHCTNHIGMDGSVTVRN